MEQEFIEFAQFKDPVSHMCLTVAMVASWSLIQHQTCKPVMVSDVSSSPTGGNFIFLRHLDANFVQK